MCTMVRELWLTGWKGKKGGFKEREREVRSTGNTIVTKDRRWLWGLQYFCYGTLNSYEFSNATTAVNNGESARNNGGRNTPGWARETHFLPPFSRSAYFSSSSSLEFGGSRNRSIDRSIDFCFSSRPRNLASGEKEIKSLGHRLVNVSRKIASGFSCLYIGYTYSILNSRNFDF